ncbi:MAG: uracil-DNA glycosylase [Myxococcaceae bacterium]|nr:uracil-DNA glycosylase [Myxococcaceae bacterium]
MDQLSPQEAGLPAQSPLSRPLPHDWEEALAAERRKPYFKALSDFLVHERSRHTVYPSEADLFSAFRLTPLSEVRVLILGQDPYHGKDQAHGLAFSVKPGVPPPPSLQNIFKELHDDLGVPVPKHGHLAHWAKQGVLLLNAVLTVRAGQANSHQGKGWELFTDAAIRAVNAKTDPVVFVFWGRYAQRKVKLVDSSRHFVLVGAHPSPLSANQGFLGSRPFSRINTYLREHGRPPIDWALPKA